MSKLSPIEVSSSDSIYTVLDKCHDAFKTNILTKNRPTLAGREIYIPINWIENKADIFWHISSIDSKPNLDILPCTNDIVSSICDCNCIKCSYPIIIRAEEREKCIYRATRSSWVKFIIDLYNANDTRVVYWEKINSNKKNRIYLRYRDEEIDYIVVFEDKTEKRVVLITAYPVFFLSAKKDYDKDLKHYLSSIANKK